MRTWVSRQWPTFGIETQVLVAHVVAADPGDLSVDHHVLAVVAEVELEAVVSPLGGVELRLLDAGRLELGEIALGKAHAAHLVVQHEHLDAPIGAVDQRGFEPASETVVVDDVELDEGVVLGLGEPLEDAGERGLTVHQQRRIIAAQEGTVGESLHRLVVGHPIETLDGERFEAFPHRGLELFHLLVAAVPGFDIALEAPPSKNPIRGNRDVGEGVEADAPGDGALGGARRHDRVDRREEAEHVKDDDDGCYPHPLPSPFLRPSFRGVLARSYSVRCGGFVRCGSHFGVSPPGRPETTVGSPAVESFLSRLSQPDP